MCTYACMIATVQDEGRIRSKKVGVYLACVFFDTIQERRGSSGQRWSKKKKGTRNNMLAFLCQVQEVQWHESTNCICASLMPILVFLIRLKRDEKKETAKCWTCICENEQKHRVGSKLTIGSETRLVRVKKMCQKKRALPVQVSVKVSVDVFLSSRSFYQQCHLIIPCCFHFFQFCVFLCVYAFYRKDSKNEWMVFTRHRAGIVKKKYPQLTKYKGTAEISATKSRVICEARQWQFTFFYSPSTRRNIQLVIFSDR